MIEASAPPEGEIGTTARFGICWHDHTDPDLMSDVGPSETCGSDRMSGLRKNRPRTSLRTSRHRRDEPHTTARPMWPGSGKIGPMLWQGSRKPREAQQWRRLIGSVVNGNGALDTIRLPRCYPQRMLECSSANPPCLLSWSSVCSRGRCSIL